MELNGDIDVVLLYSRLYHAKSTYCSLCLACVNHFDHGDMDEPNHQPSERSTEQHFRLLAGRILLLLASVGQCRIVSHNLHKDRTDDRDTILLLR